jgi:hypothetical protein
MAATAPSAEVVIVCVVQVGGDPPLFLYQAILSSAKLADKTSKSPSPSRSAANTEYACIAELVMTLRVQEIGDPPPFLYQAITLSLELADSTSTRPSLSTSAADTNWAPFAVVVML